MDTQSRFYADLLLQLPPTAQRAPSPVSRVSSPPLLMQVSGTPSTQSGSMMVSSVQRLPSMSNGSLPTMSSLPLLSPRPQLVMERPSGGSWALDPRQNLARGYTQGALLENGLPLTAAQFPSTVPASRSQSSTTGAQRTVCRTFDANGREFQPLLVTSTPLEHLSSVHASKALDSTIGLPLDLDVSGIASEDNSKDNINAGQVTFDAGVGDPIVFVKGEPWSNSKSLPEGIMGMDHLVNMHNVQRQASNVTRQSSNVTRQSSASTSVPAVALGSSLEASVKGLIESQTRRNQSRQQSRQQSRSASPATSRQHSPRVPVGMSLGAAEVERDSSDIGSMEGRGHLSLSLEGDLSSMISPRQRLPSPGGSKELSKWALEVAAIKKPWSPAISKPSLISRVVERQRSSSRQRDETPPRSACSTPRRQHGSGSLYNDLYVDAAERSKRRKAAKEAREAESQNQLRSSRESSLRSTRRYRSSDKRNLLQRSEDHLRRKAALQGEALRSQRQKEEDEMKECTFRPLILSSCSSNRRAPDEREMERRLRQLAHKQLDVRARLVQLEREWVRAHRQRKALFVQRVKGVQNERKQEVFDLLNTKEGQEYYWERVQRISEIGGTSGQLAQSRVLNELLQDQRHIIERQVGEDVDTELQMVGRNLDFWARRNVLLESLEAIEARAAPTLRMLVDDVQEGATILKESGFTVGMSLQMRDDVPDPEGAGSCEASPEEEDLLASTMPAQLSPAKMPASSSTAAPQRVRSMSPIRGQTPPVAQVLTTVDVEGQGLPQGYARAAVAPLRQASSATSVNEHAQKGMPSALGVPLTPISSLALNPMSPRGSSVSSIRPASSAPMRMVSATIPQQPVSVQTGRPMATTRPMTMMGSPVAHPQQVMRMQSMPGGLRY